jgi:hypothetical protein
MMSPGDDRSLKKSKTDEQCSPRGRSQWSGGSADDYNFSLHASHVDLSTNRGDWRGAKNAVTKPGELVGCSQTQLVYKRETCASLPF